MKSVFALLSAGALAFTLTAAAQNAPHAWGDKNKDGICDVTGKAIAQGRGQGRGPGRGQMMGRQFAGRGWQSGRSQARGFRRGGCCWNAAPAQQAPPAAPPK